MTTPFDNIADEHEREKTVALFNRLRVEIVGETGQVAGNALSALLVVAIGVDLPRHFEDETFLLVLDKVQRALNLWRSGQWQPYSGLFEQLLTQTMTPAGQGAS